MIQLEMLLEVLAIYVTTWQSKKKGEYKVNII